MRSYITGEYIRHINKRHASNLISLRIASYAATMNLKIPAVCNWCWLYLVAVTLIQELPTATSTEQSRVSSDNRVVLPGPQSSCKDIHEKYPEYRNIPGYYWMDDYCAMEYNGVSCEDIHAKYPETRDRRGFYVIGNEWVFCNMTAISMTIPSSTYRSSCAGVEGEWTRIAHFNISAGDDCPYGWNKDTHSGISFCMGPPKNHSQGFSTCYPIRFSSNKISYKSVCGRARGYQKGIMEAFQHSFQFFRSSLELAYVDGLSITHGNEPRHHIWSYAVGSYDGSIYNGCPCDPRYKEDPPPSTVNNNYYCESGATDNPSSESTYFFSDPLWDGSGCSTNNTCCSNERLPWFYHNLGNSTTDDIEVRICVPPNGGVLVDQLELYIQ